MRPRRAALLLALLLAGSAGLLACRTGGDGSGAIAVAPGHAICPVCRCSGDLACQDVTIRSDTPSSMHLGTAYYFCSRQCLQDFEKSPAAYLPR